MKRTLLMIGVLCGLVVSPVWGKAPWGEDKHAAGQTHGIETLETISQQQEPEMMHSILPYMLTQKTVRVAVDISPLGPENASLQKQFEEEIRDLYKQWFYETVLWASERAEEFEDVISLLDKGINLQFVKKQESEGYRNCEVEITIYPTLKKFQQELGKDESTLGLFRPGGVYTPMEIFIHLEDQDTWLHEIGHTLGFADEYEEGYTKNASPVYRSAQRATYSIMLDQEGTEQDAAGPTCADAEGLINMLDAWTVRLAKRKHPTDWPKYVSKRITGGWRSFDFGLEDFYLLGASIHTLFEQRQQLSSTELDLLEKAFLNHAAVIGELSPAEKEFLQNLQKRNALKELKQHNFKVN